MDLFSYSSAIVVSTFLAVVFTFYEVFSIQKHLLVVFSAPGESALLCRGCVFREYLATLP